MTMGTRDIGDWRFTADEDVLDVMEDILGKGPMKVRYVPANSLEGMRVRDDTIRVLFDFERHKPPR